MMRAEPSSVSRSLVTRRVVAGAGIMGVVSVALLLVVVKSGVWPTPSLRWLFAISQSLTRNPIPDPSMHALYTTYLQPALFGILGGDDLDDFFVYCGLVSLVFFVVLMLCAIRVHGPAWKLLAIAVFPVLTVPFYWVGNDGGTLLMLLATTVTLRGRWSIVFALLLSWQHFEQGLVAFSILAVTFVLTRQDENLEHVVMVLVALVAGKLAMMGLFHLFSIQLGSDRLSAARFVTTAGESFARWGPRWYVMVWSLFGSGWLLLLWHVRRTWPVLAVVPVAVLVLVTVVDQTRVGAMVLFPALVHWVLLNRELWREIRPRFVSLVLAVYLLVPYVFMWTGVTCGSVSRYTVEQVRAGFDITRFGDFDYVWPYLDMVTGACWRGAEWT